MINDRLSPKGLFGGLTAELKLSVEALKAELTRQSALVIDHLIDVEDWCRGGAETFIGVGEIWHSGTTCIRVVGKAFVGWGTPPVEQQRRWERRRTQLAAQGILVPQVFASFPGLTIEQFIGHNLPPYADLTETDVFALGKIAAALRSLNIKPLSIHADIRRENCSLYYVDFGQDLVENVFDGDWLEAIRGALAPMLRNTFQAGFESLPR